ncbi:MAG: serine/threonine protein kinase [Deltaproteobacteria bacterium]|nr:serine/threonine protein kinase [Deltaproteobacteria bacterium]
MTTGPSSAPTQTIGRYELVSRIGLGGMAEVWLARQRSFGGFERQVALKRILPSLASDPRFVEAFATEAHLAASLSHPHIVQIHDLEDVGGELVIAMELVRGETLQAMIRRAWELTGQTIPAALAAGIVARVARALHHAHTRADLVGRPQGLVHRDVSPANVLVGFRGEVKVVDFGIARALGGSTAGMGGRGGYLSPEQARGEEVDARSDVFSAGVVLWELLTGMRLYGGLESAETRRLIASDTPARSAAEARSGIDPRLVAIAARALAKHPRQRFQDAAELAGALEAIYLEGVPSGQDPIVLFEAELAALMGKLFRDRLELWAAPASAVPTLGALPDSTLPDDHPPDTTDPDEVPPALVFPTAAPPPIAQAPIAQAPIAQAPIAQAPIPEAQAPMPEARAPMPEARAPLPPREPRRLPIGWGGHALAIAGALLFLAGSFVLPWQRFELADLAVRAFELNLLGLVMSALGAAPIVASVAGLATGRRHVAARVNVALAAALLLWLVVAAIDLHWGKRLMTFESVGLEAGFVAALVGALAVLGGAVAVFGALPRWDATTALLRLRLLHEGRLAHELVVYEPRTIDPRVDLAGARGVPADALGELPRVRITREGDTTLIRDGAPSRRIGRGARGHVEAGPLALEYAFVRSTATHAPVRLLRWTETLALAVLTALVVIGAGLASILAWDEDAVRPPRERDHRTPRVELAFAEDRPKEDVVREVDVDLQEPDEVEPKVVELSEERYGDARVVEEAPAPRARPERAAARGDDKGADAVRDELMRRLAGPTDGAQKLAAIGAIASDTPGGSLSDASKVLADLPSGAPGFAADGRQVATGPIAGDKAAELTKKLTAPPKVAGNVRGKVTGMKSATKVSGALDPGQVYSVIDANIAKIQACYESRLQIDASLAGRITFRWTVTPSGSVTGVAQNVSTVADPKVAACIKAVLERLRFPKPEGGSVEISYPFIFRSS